MKYRIIVDKQPRKDPSGEKKEYIIDIEELRKKGEIYDSLIITKDEDYVIRRLSLSEYCVLSVLAEPTKEELNLNIELFEGDNYIYLMDMQGNKIYAEYLINNDFNDLYATKVELNSVIEQTFNSILSKVEATYATGDELNTVKNTLTASLELKINTEDLISEINASADVITLQSGRLVINSGNFQLDSSGKITAISGKIGGFTLDSTKFEAIINGIYDYNRYDANNILCTYVGHINETSITSNLYDLDGDGQVDAFDAQDILEIVAKKKTNTKKIAGTFKINSEDAKNCISIERNGNLAVSIGIGGINSHLISAENIVCSTNSSGSFSGVAMNGSTGEVLAKSFNNSSLAEMKKNIEELKDTINIIENAEIYKFNYKTEEDKQKKHIGFVIGEGYKTPEEVISTSGKGIDMYTMTSIEWKCLQECIKIIKDLKRRVETLEGVE